MGNVTSSRSDLPALVHTMKQNMELPTIPSTKMNPQRNIETDLKEILFLLLVIKICILLT